jgi:aarF domain-containing kinase
LFIHNFVHGDLHPGNILVQDTHQPRLVLLDCGIVTSLTPFDLLQMRALFTAIVKGDGVLVADLMLGSQPCPTVEEYRRNMAELVSRGLQGLTRIQNVKVSNLFSELFDVLMKHKVRIEPNYTSVVMAIMVIEGLGRSLDPSLNLLEAVTPCLLHRARTHIADYIVGT